MKKKILICLLTAVLALSGCSSSAGDTPSQFIVIEAKAIYDYRIVYHRETKVMYVISYSGYCTLLVNPDGMPQLYE